MDVCGLANASDGIRVWMQALGKGVRHIGGYAGMSHGDLAGDEDVPNSRVVYLGLELLCSSVGDAEDARVAELQPDSAAGLALHDLVKQGDIQSDRDTSVWGYWTLDLE
ncbi:hypothetical protein RHMOL_Rhmol07G0199800 [Rhododendron molle]|uniref:Uncharacterized protein n=1 Tax=Rhododendron molle TaxID=49168 RepID=A0ACC0N3N6_RHOML|nr:hypothetical protein RHMOL_Rhmol07G0199800 [Rhododendron molle]